MLIEGLVSYLAADAGMQAQLGTSDSRTDGTTGVFPTLAPDSVPMPYRVLQQVSGEPPAISMQGTSRLQSERWRFSCYGTGYKQAKLLARALKLALLGLDGTLPAGDSEVHGAWMQLQADDAESMVHGTIYATHVDFNINFYDNEA
jgi:hypothetical protein